MKKKIIIISIIGVVVIVLGILSIPKKYHLTDGGTIKYEAVTWSYTKYNAYHPDNKLFVGEKLTILGITFKDTTKEVDRENPDKNAITGITSFEYAYGSYNNGYYDYKIEKDNNKITFEAKGTNGIDLDVKKEITSSDLSKLEKILNDNKAYKYNNIGENNNEVLDGYSFGIFAIYGDFKTLSISTYGTKSTELSKLESDLKSFFKSLE